MLGFAASGQICELMLDNVPAGIAIFDRDMRYLGCSRRFREDFGLGDRDVVGQLHYDVFPGMPEDVRATHRRVMAGATESAELDTLRWPDGSVDWVEWKMMPWRDEAGEIGGALLLANRKTDQVVLQTREQTTHVAMQLLIDSAADYAIIMAGLDQKISMWSSGAERLFGWTASEAIGQALSIIQVPDQKQARGIDERLSRILEMGGFRDRGWRRRKDGSQVMVDLTATPIRDQFGRLIAYCGVLRDITPELERERVLRESEARLRSIIDTVPDAMITMDEFGIVESFSAAAERLFGYQANEVVGQNVSMLMPEPDRSRHDGYLARYRQGGARRIIGMARRVMGQRKDGSVFAHELHVGEFQRDGLAMFTGFIRDLTQREADAAQLREVEAELAQISRGAALATMGSALAHELNQPLTAIANYLQAAGSIDLTQG
ncbi:MAG: PAS domain S-box protein, partial [bacterium]